MTPSDDPRDDSRDDSHEERDGSRDDEVWQDIVDRYGDKALPDDLPEAGSEVEAGAADPSPETWNPVPWEDEGRFVPPTPPPIPMPPAPRLAAWLGLFGAPAIFLLFLVLSWSMPSWASTLLIVWFVAGFGFLVATMGSGPRDPGDDGAVV